MTNQDYPYNLIRAIYNDHENDNTHVKQIDLPNFYRTLELMPNNERIILIGRYQDRKTFKESGRPVGESSAGSVQLVKKALRRLKRYGRHNYFTINPTTGLAYRPDEIEPYIGELKLEAGTENALFEAQQTTIKQVRGLTEEQLKRFRNFGEKHYQDFAEKLAAYELAHGLTPIPKAAYPTNLLHAVYPDEKDQVHADKVGTDGIVQALTTLSHQEQLIVTMKYKDGKSMNDIAKNVGLNTTRISQTIRKALLKMNTANAKTSGTDVALPKSKYKPDTRPQLDRIYPFNLLTHVFGRDNNLKSVYIQGIHDQVAKLPDTYKTYVLLRYEFGLTRQICSKRMNLSMYQIEQLEMQVHRKLRDKKDDGYLTAASTIHLNYAKQTNRELERENRAYKKLVSAIADGTIKPEDLVIQEPKTEKERIDPLLALPIEELDLSVRAHKALSRNRWDTVGHIINHTVEELGSLRNIGVTVVEEIIDKLASYGLTLKDDTRTDKTTPKRNTLTPLTVSDAEKGLHGEKLVIEIEKE